jgi:hypothetical protein
MEWKYLTFLGEFKPLFHVDDYSTEINYINKNTSVRGISCYKTNNWINKCNKLLNEKFINIGR